MKSHGGRREHRFFYAPLLALCISVCWTLGGKVASARKDCDGTYSTLVYDQLKARFENCEVVQGDLNLGDLEQESENRTYDFLSSIREISGYLRVSRGRARNLPLRNLAVIRGETLYTLGALKYGLFVSSASSLQTMELLSLGDVQAGGIGFFNVPMLCFVRKSIQWDDIIKSDQSRLVSLSGAGGSASQCGNCSQSCRGSCWAAGNSSCQDISYLDCQGCGGRRCVASNPQICCHSECVGGCTGPANSQCLACKNYNNSGSCVASCPPLKKLDTTTFEEVDNPDGRYAYRHDCVRACPGSLLVEGQFCVDRCSSGRQISGRTCQLCNGPCPLRCNGTIGEFNSQPVRHLHPGNSWMFENCTVVDGSIRITLTSVLGNSVTAPISQTDLDYLSSIRVITGCLVVTRLHFAKDLSFLGNLESILGLPPQECAGGTVDYGLLVNGNRNLTSLSLSSLQQIGNPALVYTNPMLCYAETISWPAVVAVSNIPSRAILNGNVSLCVSNGLVCHDQCNASFGCWGPSAADCLRCAGFRYEGVCRPSCNTTRLTYGNTTVDQCLPCHPECMDSCSGPLASQCARCRHFSINGACVERCPTNTYADAQQRCVRCAAVCKDGCSGGGSYLGQGGCNDCGQVVRPGPSINGSVVEKATCLSISSPCPNSTYRTSPNDIGDPYFGKQVCDRCHPQCKVCSGPASTDCSICVNVRFGSGTRGECISQCPVRYYAERTTGGCMPCSQQCDPTRSCRGPLASDCDQCLHFNQSAAATNTTNTTAVTVADTATLPSFECVPQCLSSLYILGTSQSPVCVDQCPSDNYADTARNCRRCSVLCSPVNGCSGPEASQCGRCLYALLDGVCIAQCPGGYIVRNTSVTSSQLAPRQCLRQVNNTNGGGNNPGTAESIVGPGVGAGIGCAVAAAVILVLLVVGRRRYNHWKKQRSEKECLEMQARDNPVYGTGEEQMITALQPTPARKAPARGEFKIIPRPALEIGEQLGAGAYGIVYRGTWSEDGVGSEEVAIKVLNSAAAGSAYKELLDESAVMISLRHVNLIQVLGICMEPSIMMVSELAPLGSLLDFLRLRKATLYGHNLLLYCQQISSGMQYLEEQSVVHCDLAARNVLVEHPNLVKLTDFGLARLLDVGQDAVAVDANQKLPIKWLAPETIRERAFTHASDIWSYGITAWEVLTFGNAPYRRVPLREVLPLLQAGERLPQPKVASDDLFSLIMKCWSLRPSQRPRFGDIYTELSMMRLNSLDYVQTKADKLATQPGVDHQPDFDEIQVELAGYEDDGYMEASGEADYDNSRTPAGMDAAYDNTQDMQDIEDSYDNPLRHAEAAYDNTQAMQDVEAAYDNTPAMQDVEAAYDNTPAMLEVTEATCDNTHAIFPVESAYENAGDHKSQVVLQNKAATDETGTGSNGQGTCPRDSSISDAPSEDFDYDLCHPQSGAEFPDGASNGYAVPSSLPATSFESPRQNNSLLADENVVVMVSKSTEASFTVLAENTVMSEATGDTMVIGNPSASVTDSRF